MGENSSGQLGDGNTTDLFSSKQVVDANVSAVFAGMYHSLFLKADGSLWGMGVNGSGQLNRLIVPNSREALQAVFQSAD